MTRKVMSIRGEIVDFDLFEIKKQILNTPTTEDGKKRERFIDKKRRRTSRGSFDQLLAQQKQNEAAVREALAKKKMEEVVVDTPVVQEVTPIAAVITTPIVEVPVKKTKQIIKKKTA